MKRLNDMNSSETFEYYRSRSAPMPRNPGELQGMYLLRRFCGGRPFSVGVIRRIAEPLRQLELIEYTNRNQPTWLAFAVLAENAVLFYGQAEARQAMKRLYQVWNAEQAVERRAGDAQPSQVSS